MSCGPRQATPPGRASQCVPVSSSQKSRDINHNIKSHEGLLHLPNKKKKDKNQTTQTQTKRTHEWREGLGGPAGLWLPGVIHSCVIQEQGHKGPSGGTGVKKYGDFSLPVDPTQDRGGPNLFKFFMFFGSTAGPSRRPLSKARTSALPPGSLHLDKLVRPAGQSVRQRRRAAGRRRTSRSQTPARGARVPDTRGSQAGVFSP